jgi:two-component system response regulator BaeR
MPQRHTRLLDIDVEALTARICKQLLDLTPTEFTLFAAMTKCPGTIFSRAPLLDPASRENLEVTDRAIDSHIKNLRRKLAVALRDSDIIHSVYDSANA